MNSWQYLRNLTPTTEQKQRMYPQPKPKKFPMAFVTVTLGAVALLFIILALPQQQTATTATHITAAYVVESSSEHFIAKPHPFTLNQRAIYNKNYLKMLESALIQPTTESIPIANNAQLIVRYSDGTLQKFYIRGDYLSNTTTGLNYPLPRMFMWQLPSYQFIGYAAWALFLVVLLFWRKQLSRQLPANVKYRFLAATLPQIIILLLLIPTLTLLTLFLIATKPTLPLLPFIIMVAGVNLLIIYFRYRANEPRIVIKFVIGIQILADCTLLIIWSVNNLVF